MAKTLSPSGFFRSTSVRLSLRFAALYSVLTALVFVMAYMLAEHEITSWVEDQLIEEEAVFTRVYNEQGLEAVTEQVSRLGNFNFEDHRIFLLSDANGNHLTGNVERIALDESSRYVDASAIEFSISSSNDAAGYIIRDIELGANRLVLGTSTYFLAELLEGLRGGLIVGLLFVLVVGAITGIVVGRRTERKLLQVSGTLQTVAKGNLDVRVPVDGRDMDDLARLSTEINRTISQLQKMVESQKQISADIAHDLRTPMQRLRQRLESISHVTELPPTLATAVYETIDLADELIEIFQALLRISQIEAGARRENFSLVDMTSILARIEDAYGAVAEEKGQLLTFSTAAPSITVIGDQQLLTQMMANIVENSLSHCPEGARIDVRLFADSAQITFSVSDNGPGIPAPEREKVFRRFYRIEKSRTTPGNGLGLSLVKAITDLHDGTISLTDNHPGLNIVITFPTIRR